MRAAYAGILSDTRHCPVVTSEPGCFHSSWSDQSILVIHQCPMVDKSGCSHSSWSDQWVLVMQQCLMVDKSGCSHSDWSNQSLSYTGAWWSTAALGVSISFTSFTFTVWMKARSACKDVGAGVEYMQVRFELNYLFVWGNFYSVLRVLLQKQTMWMTCLKGSFWRLGGKTWWACHKKKEITYQKQCIHFLGVAYDFVEHKADVLQFVKHLTFLWVMGMRSEIMCLCFVRVFQNVSATSDKEGEEKRNRVDERVQRLEHEKAMLKSEVSQLHKHVRLSSLLILFCWHLFHSL